LQQLIDHYNDPKFNKWAKLVGTDFFIDEKGKLSQGDAGKPLIEVYTTGEMKDVNESDNTITHYISTPRIDYVNDVMNPFGCNDQPLRKNLGVYWNHSWGEPGSLPIAKNMWLKKTKDGVLVLTKYAVDELDFAGDIYRLTKGGFINSYSIGFFANTWSMVTLDELKKIIGGKFDIPNADEYEPNDHVWYHSDWMCYEYSAVGVPMNQDATRKGIRKALDAGVIKSTFGQSYLGALAAEREKLNLDAGDPETDDPSDDPEKTPEGSGGAENEPEPETEPEVVEAAAKKDFDNLSQRVEGLCDRMEQLSAVLEENVQMTEKIAGKVYSKKAEVEPETSGKRNAREFARELLAGDGRKDGSK